MIRVRSYILGVRGEDSRIGGLVRELRNEGL